MPPDTITPPRPTTRASREPQRAGPGLPERAGTITRQGISALRFSHSLLHLSGPRIEALAAGLNARRDSLDDDVAWWEATLALNRTLRRRGIGVQAAMAAHLASQAVLAAATRTGLAASRDVVAVARSAAEVARVLAAGDLDTTGAGYLAHGWEDLLIPPAEPASPLAPAGGRGHRTPRAAADRSRRGRRT